MVWSKGKKLDSIGRIHSFYIADKPIKSIFARTQLR